MPLYHLVDIHICFDHNIEDTSRNIQELDKSDLYKICLR